MKLKQYRISEIFKMPEKSKTAEQESKSEDRDQEENKNKGHSESKDQEGKTQNNKDNQEKSDNSDGRKKQKEYFKEELKRLKTNLDKEASKIVAPDKQEHVPYVFNSLEPYYDISTPRYLIELPEQMRHGYVSRQTAVGLCDPWTDHDMDVKLLPKIESKQVPSDDNKEKKGHKASGEKEGSTRLPKFPAVCVPTNDITKNKKIYYSDVPHIREELKKKIGANAEERVNAEYDRTKKDFYRMELDKMEEYHPTSRPKMRATYFAYLQNNPGSKKAVHECVKETEKKEKDKSEKDEKKQKQSKSNSQENRQAQTVA